jgi:hypothetical protein
MQFASCRVPVTGKYKCWRRLPGTGFREMQNAGAGYQLPVAGKCKIQLRVSGNREAKRKYMIPIAGKKS